MLSSHSNLAVDFFAKSTLVWSAEEKLALRPILSTSCPSWLYPTHLIDIAIIVIIIIIIITRPRPAFGWLGLSNRQNWPKMTKICPAGQDLAKTSKIGQNWTNRTELAKKSLNYRGHDNLHDDMNMTAMIT